VRHFFHPKLESQVRDTFLDHWQL